MTTVRLTLLAIGLRHTDIDMYIVGTDTVDTVDRGTGAGVVSLQVRNDGQPVLGAGGDDRRTPQRRGRRVEEDVLLAEALLAEAGRLQVRQPRHRHGRGAVNVHDLRDVVRPGVVQVVRGVVPAVVAHPGGHRHARDLERGRLLALQHRVVRPRRRPGGPGPHFILGLGWIVTHAVSHVELSAGLSGQVPRPQLGLSAAQTPDPCAGGIVGSRGTETHIVRRQRPSLITIRTTTTET